MSRDAARVVIYDPSMAEAFERFARAVWPRSGGIARGAHPPPVREDAPTFLFLKGNDVIGHLATIPVRLDSPGGGGSAHWIVGFMVLPEHRNGLVGPLLIKEASRTLDCALSLFVEPPVLRILTGMKWTHCGIVPQYLRVLQPLEVGRNLQLGRFEGRGPLARTGVGWGLAICQAALLGVSRLKRPGGGTGEVREEQGLDGAYDELWRSVRGRFGTCVARDREYLQRRYGARPERYRILGCRRGGRLLGYCVLKTKRFSGDARMGDIKLGTIVDCLFDPDSTAAPASLFATAVQAFRHDGMHAVLCTASHASVARALRSTGFFAIPGNLHFALYTRRPMREVPIEGWHLMRGDSDADQNF